MAFHPAGFESRMNVNIHSLRTPPQLMGLARLKSLGEMHSMSDSNPNRRDFMKKAAGVGATLGVAANAFAARPAKASTGRVIGANDRINVGVVGVGGRGAYLARTFAGIGERSNDCKVVAVCDVYEKRKRETAERLKCDGFLDYREVIHRPDID